jgi:hypothetical protein
MKKVIIFILILYLQLTIGEVLIHKYIMHNNPNTIARKFYGNSHVIHHSEVYEDMKMKPDFLEEGMYFSILTTTEIFLIILFTICIDNKLLGMGLKLQHLAIISLVISIFYYIVWNIIHIEFHRIKGDKLYYNNRIFNYFLKNHSYHHLQKGIKKGNYNIIFIGGDHIMNSHRTCIDNKQFCNEFYDKHKQLCNMERRRDPLPNGLKWC